MNILFLGYTDSAIIDFLANKDVEVAATTVDINGSVYPPDLLSEIDWIISYGYRHIIKKQIIDRFPGRIINLHIGYLPYNRGADPNFWSAYDKTPAGVTIHQIDEGIDTGDILVQEEVFFTGEETLAESYQALQEKIQLLFMRNWKAIRDEIIQPKKQTDYGSYHRKGDMMTWLYNHKIKEIE